MNRKNLDLDLSVNQRIAFLLGGVLFIPTSLFNLQGWGILMLLGGLGQLVFFILLTFNKNKFARGINFLEDKLELKNGIFRKPVLIEWEQIENAEFHSRYLELNTKQGIIAFDYTLSPSQIKLTKERLALEFQKKKVEFK